MNDKLETAMAIATLIAAIAAAISAGVSWDAQKQSAAAAAEAKEAVDRANEASDRANETRDEANRLRRESNATADRALREAERSNLTADRALGVAEEANEHRKGLRDIEQARFDEEQAQKHHERSASLRCQQIGGDSSHQTLNANFAVFNDGPARAYNVSCWAELNGEQWGNEPNFPLPLLTNLESRINVPISPRLRQFRTAIPADQYRVICEYEDSNPPSHLISWCFHWEGEGTDRRPGDLTLHWDECTIDSE